MWSLTLIVKNMGRSGLVGGGAECQGSSRGTLMAIPVLSKTTRHSVISCSIIGRERGENSGGRHHLAAQSFTLMSLIKVSLIRLFSFYFDLR